MRAIPIPDDLEPGARRVVIGEPGDPTRDDVRPCEYLVGNSLLYPGRYTFSALIELDEIDRVKIAAGGRLVFTLDGGELPWEIGVLDR